MEMYDYMSAATVEIYIYACKLLFSLRRRVYFLNICYIRVFYRLNRNRALQVGIRAWLVLSGLVSVEFSCSYANGNGLPSVLVLLCCCSYLLVVFPVVCDMYRSTVGTCSGVPFF
jgi:hypothetical protein